MQGAKSIARELKQGALTLTRLAGPRYTGKIQQMIDLVVEAYAAGAKVVALGNGGSAADAQHFVTELVVRLKDDRPPLRALALTTNTSTLTAAANDYGYDQVFARQVEAQVDAGDVVMGISTSGNSPNVLKAVAAARRRGAVVVGLTNSHGGKLKRMCDRWLGVPGSNTQHVQEGHIAVLHVICHGVEQQLYRKPKKGRPRKR